MHYMTLDAEQREAFLASLASMPEFLSASFSALSLEQTRTLGPGGISSPVEQVWHLADLEREGFGARISRLLHESDPYLPDFDGTRIAAERDYRTRGFEDGLRAFTNARVDNLSILRTLDTLSWLRPGTQEGVGRVSLCDIPSFMFQHDAAHRAEIEAWLSSVPRKTITRQVVVETLTRHLVACESVLAMWQAGSAAFGRTDDYSDVDVGLLAKSGRNEEIWLTVDRAFDELGGVALRWQEPNPLFKGLDKRICRLLGASRWLQVDIGIFPESAEELYNQPQRHGRVIVAFDRAGRLTPSAWDEAAHHQHMCEALHQTVMKWETYRAWFRKEVARERTVDAFAMFYAATVVPLVAVLGMRYRPARWDFGMRYLKEDMPADVVNVIERLCYVPGPAHLEERFAEADILFGRTLAELAERGIAPLNSSGIDILRNRHDTEGR